MNTSPERLGHCESELNELTEHIIGSAFKVANTLGCGFLEKVYENALAVELRKQGLQFKQQAPISVRYESTIVGKFFADLIVSDSVILELKAVSELSKLSTAQCLNYLKATRVPICLLINFGKPRIDIRRFRI